MQDAIPYRAWATNQNNSSSTETSSTIYLKVSDGHDLKSIVDETPLIVFMKKGDCMGHVVKRLLQGLGVNPAVYEVDEKDEVDVCKELTAKIGGRSGEGPIQFPAVVWGAGSCYGYSYYRGADFGFETSRFLMAMTIYQAQDFPNLPFDMGTPSIKSGTSLWII